MANGLLLSPGMVQFFGNDGAPLALGTVDYYVPGTTTRKTTWKDEAQAAANQNPVTLDATGRATVWGVGLYRMVLKDAAGNTIYDDVTGSLTGPDDVLAIPANIQNGAYTSADDTGAANAYAITLSPAPVAYVKYQRFSFKALNNNTGASTLNVNGLGAVSIVYPGGSALSSGAILAGAVYQVVYDGSKFEIVGGSSSSSGSSGMKNRVINGAVNVDQRHTTAVVTLSATMQYGPDKWKARRGASGVATLQASNGGPGSNGFPNCLVYGVTTGAIPGATDQAIVEQDIEGLFFYDALFGSASGQTLSLSFYMFATATGTYGGALQNSAQTRSYPFTFTVGNVGWSFHSIIIPPDVTGTWIGATTGIGCRLIFDMGSGVNFEAPAANAWQTGNYTRFAGCATPIATSGSSTAVTGVQLEIASAPTAFENRPYDDEVRHCQRYYEPVPGSFASGGAGPTGFRSGTAIINVPISFANIKRVAPALVTSTPIWSSAGDPLSANAVTFFDVVLGAFSTITGALTISFSRASTSAVVLGFSAGTSFNGTAGNPGFLTIGQTALLGADADF
jgi:hypothetical protein